MNPRPRVRLTVVYDEECALCRRARHWLSLQRTHVDVAFLPIGSPQASERYAHLPWYGAELMVVADDGRAWVGPAAFVMCLWATVRWRPTAHRMRSPAVAPIAERVFHSISSRRHALGAMLEDHRCDDCTIHRPPPPHAPQTAQRDRQ